MNPKLKTPTALSRTIKRLKAKGKKTVFTNGCFDILHVGHIAYLNKAKKTGDILVVGLNSDSSIRAIKGMSRPINNQRDRARLLASLSFVDYIVIFNEPTPEKLIRHLRPDVLVKGADWKAKDIVGGAFVKSYGGRVARIPFVKGYSTTSIIKKMARK